MRGYKLHPRDKQGYIPDLQVNHHLETHVCLTISVDFLNTHISSNVIAFYAVMATINYANSDSQSIGNVSSTGEGARPRRKCLLCQLPFKSAEEFTRHLRDFHCSKEGGSFVCRYGLNNVCPSLPLEGVSDTDYKNHIARDHVQSHQHPRTTGEELGSLPKGV